LDECDSKMTESACDSKIRHDLAIAIRNNPKECLFEPDWRPTSLKESALHVSKVDSATVQTVIEGKQYSLNLEGYHDDTCRNSERSRCPYWRPKAGQDYPATVRDQPTYLNSCLHKLLRAKREVCVGFGKLKEEVFPYGISRTSEFNVCYGLPTSNRD